MPTSAYPRPLTSNHEIHAVLGFKDAGIIDWGFTEDDLPTWQVEAVSPRSVAHSVMKTLVA